MSAATTTSIDPILKRLYSKDRFEKALYTNNPLLGLLPKNEDFGGADMRIALMYAPTAGGSATFSNSQSNQVGAAYKGFNLTRVSDYSTFLISSEALKASKGDANALVSGLETEGDAALHTLQRSIAKKVYRNGGGAIGRVGSTSTVTLTLLELSDIVNFEVNMKIDSDDVDGTSGAVDGDARVITKVDRDLGTLTTAANWTGSGNYANSDYLFRDGDFGLAMSGLDAWVPSSAPASTAFFGVDRTADATRLGGIRFTASAGTDGTLERALIRAAARVAREGGKPDYVFMNPEDAYQLDWELGTKRQYETVTAQSASGSVGTIGYDSIRVVTPGGSVKVCADHNCPKGVAWMLQMDTWILASLGPAAGWLMDDGNRILRASTSDAYEGRMGGYMNLGCRAPGWNARLNISAVVNATV